MPRINPTFRSMAFILFGTNPMTGEEEPIGSGVLVGLRAARTLHARHIYAVTCNHCLLAGGHSVRLNTRDGKSRKIEIDQVAEWKSLGDGTDLAAADITDKLEVGVDEHSACPADLWVTRDFITETEFGVGEDGFMLGLFADHPGKDRNLIAARFGNVSLLAQDDEPLDHHGSRRPYHIFDMRSRPGFSGSPVFAYRTPSSDLRTAVLRGADKKSAADVAAKAIRQREAELQRQAERDVTEWRVDPSIVRHYPRSRMSPADALEMRNNTFLMLFGIHVGQYADEVKILKQERANVQAEAALRDGDLLKIPNSMSLVAPMWDVDRLLQIEYFDIQRKERERRDEELRGNTAELEASTPRGEAV